MLDDRLAIIDFLVYYNSQTQGGRYFLTSLSYYHPIYGITLGSIAQVDKSVRS